MDVNTSSDLKRKGKRDHTHSRRLSPEELDDLAEKYASLASSSNETQTVTEKKGKKKVVEEEPVVKETIKEIEMRRVQPVIHRVREQTEIRHVIKPIIQTETAPVSAREVIRETGRIREQVPVRTVSCSCEDANVCTCNSSQSHEATPRDSNDVHPLSPRHRHSIFPHRSKSNDNDNHNNVDSLQYGALAASARVTCTHSNDSIQIHIHPVIYAIGPGSSLDLIQSMSANSLCSNCSSRAQVMYHEPYHHDAPSPREGERDTTIDLKDDGSTTSNSNSGSHRISRLFNKLKHRSHSHKSMSQELSAEEIEHQNATYKPVASTSSPSSSSTAGSSVSDNMTTTSSKHVEFDGEQILGRDRSSSSRDDLEKDFKKEEAIDDNTGNAGEEEIIRIIHTPVVI